mgnify:CR=1 FL=1
MANTSQKVIAASMVVSGLVALVALLDLALQIPFGRQIVMDVMFLVGAGLVIYMGVDAYRDIQ